MHILQANRNEELKVDFSLAKEDAIVSQSYMLGDEDESSSSSKIFFDSDTNKTAHLS